MAQSTTPLARPKRSVFRLTTLPPTVKHVVLQLVAIGALLLFVFHTELLEQILRVLFPDAVAHIYDRIPLSTMLLQHLQLVLLSTSAAVLTGLGIGIAVTRRWGRQFLTLAQGVTSLVQTIPPVAVLAIVTPVLGFGFVPTVVALYLFSILPVLNSTITGILSVPSPIIDMSKGMGMSASQILWRVELPLAAQVISSGVRVSTVINIGTATVGAIIGAGGFGVVIIAGLVRNNPAFILSGAFATCTFALIINATLKHIEGSFYQHR